MDTYYVGLHLYIYIDVCVCMCMLANVYVWAIWHDVNTCIGVSAPLPSQYVQM